jgi:signal transduction histidine kinase
MSEPHESELLGTGTLSRQLPSSEGGSLHLTLASGRHRPIDCDPLGRHGERFSGQPLICPNPASARLERCEPFPLAYPPECLAHEQSTRRARCPSSQKAGEEPPPEVEDLYARFSHELRSPLTAIKGYAATLLRHEQRLPREERREFLEAIGQASERLQETIDRLLEMSQLAAGTVRIERFPVAVARLVDDAVLAARGQMDRRAPDRFTFTVRDGSAPDGPGAREALTLGDARRLRRVMDHLLENAIKYSPDGGTIAVTLRVCDDASNHAARHAAPDAMVEIEVRDSGVGIPPDHLERVFERFHRVDTRLAREAEGMGLGLAIAKRIVELHGGAIWAESGLGNGSAFYVRLPLMLATEDRQDAPDSTEFPRLRDDHAAPEVPHTAG